MDGIPENKNNDLEQLFYLVDKLKQSQTGASSNSLNAQKNLESSSSNELQSSKFDYQSSPEQTQLKKNDFPQTVQNFQAGYQQSQQQFTNSQRVDDNQNQNQYQQPGQQNVKFQQQQNKAYQIENKKKNEAENSLSKYHSDQNQSNQNEQQQQNKFSEEILEGENSDKELNESSGQKNQQVSTNQQSQNECEQRQEIVQDKENKTDTNENKYSNYQDLVQQNQQYEQQNQEIQEGENSQQKDKKSQGLNEKIVGNNELFQRQNNSQKKEQMNASQFQKNDDQFQDNQNEQIQTQVKQDINPDQTLKNDYQSLDEKNQKQNDQQNEEIQGDQKRQVEDNQNQSQNTIQENELVSMQNNSQKNEKTNKNKFQKNILCFFLVIFCLCPIFSVCYFYFYGNFQKEKQSVIQPEYKKVQDIYLVLGVTGSGKSSFVASICQNLQDFQGVGCSFNSFTSEINTYNCQNQFIFGNRSVQILDFPGYHDTHNNEYNILNQFQKNFMENYEFFLNIRGIFVIEDTSLPRNQIQKSLQYIKNLFLLSDQQLFQIKFQIIFILNKLSNNRQKKQQMQFYSQVQKSLNLTILNFDTGDFCAQMPDKSQNFEQLSQKIQNTNSSISQAFIDIEIQKIKEKKDEILYQISQFQKKAANQSNFVEKYCQFISKFKNDSAQAQNISQISQNCSLLQKIRREINESIIIYLYKNYSDMLELAQQESQKLQKIQESCKKSQQDRLISQCSIQQIQNIFSTTVGFAGFAYSFYIKSDIVKLLSAFVTANQAFMIAKNPICVTDEIMDDLSIQINSENCPDIPQTEFTVSQHEDKIKNFQLKASLYASEILNYQTKKSTLQQIFLGLLGKAQQNLQISIQQSYDDINALEKIEQDLKSSSMNEK